jgi:hypothetical protein
LSPFWTCPTLNAHSQSTFCLLLTHLHSTLLSMM